MKRHLVLATGALALVAGSAFAGENCFYGQKQASIASAEDTVEPIVVDEQDPKLLAMLKRQEEMKLEQELPVIHN